MKSRYERRYDKILKDVILTLKEDYAGFDEVWPEYTPTFYITAAGTKHHHNELYDDLFLQYVSQMLATTGDRSLRLALDTYEDYQPWTPGFFARRVGENLVVTEVFEDNRLTPGDLIVEINKQSPVSLRENLQKNFFYSEEPEREIWHGLLKMADHMVVQRADGSREDIPLKKFPRRDMSRKSELKDLGGGTVYFAPGTFDGSIADFAEENRSKIADCKKLIIDLRHGSGDSDEDILALLPFVVSGTADYEAVLAQEPVLTNYTAKNCACVWYPVQNWMDENGHDDELAAFVEEVKAKSGAGWIEEPCDRWSGVSGKLQGLAPEKVVLITDTWCENAAEAFAEIAAKQPNVTVIGRPTMGTLDYSNHVSKVLDEGYTFTWPISKRKSVISGGGIKGKGLPVDIYIPFTAEEAVKDTLLQEAIKL